MRNQHRDASSAPPSLDGRTAIGTLHPNRDRVGFAIQAQDMPVNGAEQGEPGMIVAIDMVRTGEVTKPTIFIIDWARDKGAAGGSITSSTMPLHTGRIRIFGKPGCQFGAAEW